MFSNLFAFIIQSVHTVGYFFSFFLHFFGCCSQCYKDNNNNNNRIKQEVVGHCDPFAESSHRQTKPDTFTSTGKQM